jgi:hypothetical protein
VATPFADWSTYELSNFLLFSPRTYHRLFELYNRATWPLAIAAALLVPLLAFLLLRRGATVRLPSSILAAAWLWVAFAFHLQRYATIQWVAPWFAAAFAIEGLLLLGASVSHQPPSGPRRIGVAHGLVILGTVVQPLIGPLLLGRPWWQIELFALAPDPTAVATLGGLLLLERGWRRNLLLIVPLAWCAVAGLTQRAMAAPDFWVAPLAALLALVEVVRDGR